MTRRLRLAHHSNEQTRRIQDKIDKNVRQLREYYANLSEIVGKKEADTAFREMLEETPFWGLADYGSDSSDDHVRVGSLANHAAFVKAGFKFTPETRMINVKQPWAYGLVAGIKDVENRSYDLRVLPVQVLIVASKSPPTAENAAKFRANGGKDGHYDFQAIIGAVEFSASVKESDSAWFNKGGTGWVVSKHVRFPHPIRDVPGKLGLLYVKNLEPGLHARILKELGF